MQAEDPQAWVLVLALPPTHCVTLGKSLKPPKSQFPHMPNKGCGSCNPRVPRLRWECPRVATPPRPPFVL